MNKSLKDQFRQGDVLVERIEGGIPEGCKLVDPENGRVILAHGELTGHAHAIAADEAVALMEAPTGERFLRIKRRTTLRHEEHRAITLDTGDYKVTRQREYVRGDIRQVAD